MKRYWSKQSWFGKFTMTVALGCAAIVAAGLVVSGILAAVFINRSCATTEVHATVCTSSFDILGIRDNIVVPAMFSFMLIGLFSGFANGLSNQLREARETGETHRAAANK